MKIKFLSLLTPLAALGALPGAVLAANITWNAPVGETGAPRDILTSGTFVDSAAWTASDTVVNGVTFNGQTSFAGGTMSFGNGSQIQVQNIAVNSAGFGAAPSTWNSSYQTLVSGGAYAVNGNGTAITLGGLTVGQYYKVQVLEAFWNTDWATSFTGGANSALLDLGVPGGNGPTTVPDYVIGKFKANAATQTISLGGSTTYVIFDAVQVRSAVPDTATAFDSAWILLPLGLAAARKLRPVPAK